MRIALFSGNYNYLREGANQALNRLVRYLEGECDHQVRVYSPVGASAAFEPAGTLVPVPSIPLPVRSEFRLATGLPGSIRRDIAAFRPNLFHVSTPDILNTRAQSFAKRLGVPIVASMHTLFETYFDYYGLGWARPLAEMHLRRFYRRSDHVLAPTEALAAGLRRMRGDDRASVWSRGIDRALFNPAQRDTEWRRSLGIHDDEIAVLFLGRLVLEKGVALFVDAVRELQARDARVRPLVVGAGPAAAAFETLPGATLTGHLEGRALARAIASADVMLAPSTTETFGNVILEAMASGTVVVSADAPNARSILEDGRTGLICPPLDVLAYVRSIASLIATPGKQKDMASAALTECERYTWDAASASVASVYADLVRPPPPARAP